MNRQYKYDAFISYRHSEPDKTIAAKLQKMLESYKPPKSVCRNFKHWHVFRDETELTTSSDLSGEIKEALNDSEFLIVVCSGKTKESRWCMEEITYFKNLHKGNNSNIITLVVDGDCKDVFPDELCNEMVAVTDADGNVKYENRKIEPLAANVADQSIKGSLKKLKTEFLRIAAPLLGCGYYTLYNRDQKRHMRRLLTVAAFVVLFSLAFGLYTSAMLWEINAQKTALQIANDNLKVKTEQLNKSNKELQETNINLEKKTKEAQDNFEEANRQKTVAVKNLAEAEKQKRIAEQNLAEANRQKKIAEDNLAEANRQRNIAEENMVIARENEARANEQTRLAQIENSENLSILSENLWNLGDGIAAIETALSALPSSDNDRPVVPRAMHVLSEEIGAFKQEIFSAVTKIKCDDHITEIGYSGNGSTLVGQDSTGIYFWDGKTGILKRKYRNEQFGEVISAPVIHFDNSGRYETMGAHEYAYGIYMRNEYNYLEGYAKDNGEETLLSGTDVLVETYNSVYKLDGATGEILWKIESDSSDIDITDTKIIFSKNAYDENYNNTGIDISVFDRDTGDKITSLELRDANIKSSSWIHWKAITEDKAYYHYDGFRESHIMVFDIENNKLVNGRVIYDSSEDTLFNEKNNTFFDKIQLYNDNLYILKTHWDIMEYDFITELVVIDETGQRKWAYSYENNYSYENHIRMEFFDKEICKNYCDVLAVAKGDSVVFLNCETGENIFTYRLDSIITDSYCSQNGFMVVITNNGYEVAVMARKIEKEDEGSEDFSMIQLHKFMSRHSLYSYFNQNYAVVNSNSNEIYIYSDTVNEDYKKIFTEPGGVDEVVVNASQTYMAIKDSEQVYIYDMTSEKIYPLTVSDEYILDGLFLSERYYVIIDSKKNVTIFDIHTGEKVFTKECEGLLQISGYEYISEVDGNLVLREKYDSCSIINKNFESVTWKPEKPGKYKEWDGGRISEIFCSDKSGKILAKIQYDFESASTLEIYDVNTGESVPVEIELIDENSKNIGIASVDWTDNGKMLVAFSDNTVGCFDTATGKCQYRVKCDTPSVVSVVSLSDVNLCVLCNDSVLYKIDIATGKICDKVDIDNENVKKATSDSTVTKIAEEYNCLILSGWDKEFSINCAYIIDLDAFDIIYSVNGYAEYHSKKNSFIVNRYDAVGAYPFYTVNELIEKTVKNKQVSISR